MQTFFDPNQLQDPEVARSNEIFRSCVHCGLCTGTCPTYQLLGDELDSPRGRIYLIKDMLENDREPTQDVVQHLDRCLGCLACMTTCPAGVHYGHLIDHGRKLVEERYNRPFFERLYRDFLAFLLPKPRLFRTLLAVAPLGRWLRFALPKPLKAAIDLAPNQLPAVAKTDRPGAHGDATKGRVAIFPGCAQQVLAPEINAATIRLLTRLGYQVEVLSADCCGAITHHIGKQDSSHSLAQNLIRALQNAEQENGRFDALVITASGCGTTVKDYGHMFQDDKIWAQGAARVGALAKDVTEFLSVDDVSDHANAAGLKVTYHSACSMQHGQKVKSQPIDLLKAGGFEVTQPAEGHLCCGSAGTYNLLQPDISAQLKQRKLANIERTGPDVVATGNIGCMKQLETGLGAVPVVHTVQLLDWATGGERPEGVIGGKS